MMNKIGRAIVEVGFIVFLFYSNLLMGEYERSGLAKSKGLVWAIRDVITEDNLIIALSAALIGYVLVESLRDKF
jgi:hypothetical protein